MVVCACASVSGHKGRPYRAECLLANGYPYSLLVFGGIRRAALVAARKRRGRGARSALHLVGVQQNRHRPVVLRVHLHIRARPHGAPRPAGTPVPFYLPGRSESAPASRFGSAKTLGRAGGAGASSALHLVGVQQNRHRSVVLRIHLHIRPERPTGLPPRGDPGSLYLPGRSESAPASRFWLRQNARTRRGRGGEFGPTSGRCPAEWSPVRRSASTPACLRRTRRAPPGNPARRTRP